MGLELRRRRLTVQGLDEESIQGFDIALFSAGGSTSGEWAPRFAAAGATVIDNSSRWRMQDDVPLVVSEVNPNALAAHPASSPTQLLDDADGRRAGADPRAAGIERLVISTYQAVSGTGRQAVDEMLDQSHALLHERAIEPPGAYAHQIAFNALPHAGSFAAGDDHTDEERKLINETRKILGDPRSASAPRACACRSSPATPRPSTCRRARSSRLSVPASCSRRRPA